MEKILVPTDLSPTAELGLKLAVEIAKRCNATVSLVNFSQHPYGSTFSAMGDITKKEDPEEDLYAIELLKSRKEKMDALVAKYQVPGVEMEVAIVDNKFKDGIDEYLRTEHIDLVVMGTSGEENAKETFTGNHTEQTIRVSSCPVLSVRDGFVAENLKTMVIGVDVISDNKVADGLVALRDLAECFRASIHLVHVRDRAKDTNLVLDQYFTQIAQIADLRDFKVVILEHDDVAEGLTNYARQVSAGFIAVIKNNKEGIFRIFSHNFSDRLIKEEGRPVVTINLQNQEP
jgi:nucleotide-binding universal stress UspA family protein